MFIFAPPVAGCPIQPSSSMIRVHVLSVDPRRVVVLRRYSRQGRTQPRHRERSSREVSHKRCFQHRQRRPTNKAHNARKRESSQPRRILDCPHQCRRPDAVPLCPGQPTLRTYLRARCRQRVPALRTSIGATHQLATRLATTREVNTYHAHRIRQNKWTDNRQPDEDEQLPALLHPAHQIVMHRRIALPARFHIKHKSPHAKQTRRVRHPHHTTKNTPRKRRVRSGCVSGLHRNSLLQDASARITAPAPSYTP